MFIPMTRTSCSFSKIVLSITVRQERSDHPCVQQSTVQHPFGITVAQSNVFAFHPWVGVMVFPLVGIASLVAFAAIAAALPSNSQHVLGLTHTSSPGGSARKLQGKF